MPDQYTFAGTAMDADASSPYFTIVVTDVTTYTDDAEYESPAYTCQSAIDELSTYALTDRDKPSYAYGSI